MELREIPLLLFGISRIKKKTIAVYETIVERKGGGLKHEIRKGGE